MNSLRRVRKEKGFTLKKLSRESGIALSTIGNIETGRYAAGTDTLEKLALVLGVTVQELLEESVTVALRAAPREPRDMTREEYWGAMMCLISDYGEDQIIGKMVQVLNDETHTAERRLMMAQCLVQELARRRGVLKKS